MIKVDARGLACPKPVINTKKELEKITEFSELFSNGGREERLEEEYEACSEKEKSIDTNCEATVIKEEDGEIEVQIVKGEAAAEVATESNDDLCDQVVFISSDRMGSGNDELGKVLIKGFIFAVTQLDTLPKTMLFYNGGATLTTEDSDSLEDLKSLEAQGVEIMTCGTCLDYYGLKDKLAVGTVTNMYSIVETMAKAGRIVRPS